MEGWKDGRVEGWKGGRMEGWKGGRVEGWKGGRVGGAFKDGFCPKKHNQDECGTAVRRSLLRGEGY